MLYLIFGQNSFEAAKKIQEIKTLFVKKNPNFLFEEIDGDNINFPDDFYIVFESLSLFSQTRLFVFKNTLSKIQNADKFFVKYTNFLKESKDIFLFYEQDLKKDDKIFKIFQNNAIKVQETKEQKESFFTPANNSVFKFVDKIFLSSGVGSFLHLEGAKMAGIDAKSLINVIFWKLKKLQKKDKRVFDLAHKVILADLNLKMDKKNEEEYLLRLAISIASKV